MTRHLAAEATLILRILFRQPGFWIPTVIFPAMLYAFFGAQAGGGIWEANAMASFCVYAVLGVGFFLFGVSVAQDRESPFARWQRSLPGSIVCQWVVLILAALIFVMIAVTFVIATALMMVEIEVPAMAWARLALVCLMSVVTATLMGIALGSFVSARAAVPLANLIYLPLAYLGGLWLPPVAMPDAINAISQWTPSRAMGQLGWAAIGGTPFDRDDLFLLGAWTLVAGGLATIGHLRHRKSVAA